MVNEIEATLRAIRAALRAGEDPEAQAAHLAALLETMPATPEAIDEVMQALLAVTEETMDELGPVVVALEEALPGEARRAGVEKAVGPLLDALRHVGDLDGPGFAEALANAIEPIDDPDAATLRAAIAALRDDDHAAAAQYAAALVLAERDGDLARATELIRQLEAIWMRRGDWAQVRALAARLARLAERAGDPAQLILANFEEALACHHLGDHTEAEHLAMRAYERAREEAPVLSARAELVLGIVLAPIDLDRARVVWHEMIERMPERPGLEPLGARAALLTAGSLAGAPGAEQARAELYRLARDIAIDWGDAELLEAAQAGLDEVD